MTRKVIRRSEMAAVLGEFWRLSLVIESAVRRGEPGHHKDVLATITALQELVKSGLPITKKKGKAP